MNKQFIKTKAIQLVVTPEKFDLITFGTFEKRPVISHNTLLYSILITYHPESIHDIESIRNQLEIKLVPYPPDHNMRALIKLEFENINVEKRVLFEKKISDFLQKFQLSEIWELPIIVKTLTGILLVPGDYGKFYWHKGVRPVDFESTNNLTSTEENDDKPKTLSGFSETINKTIFTPLYNAQLTYAEKIKFPAIFIEEEIKTKQELINWIKTNWRTTIKPAVQRLSKRNITKVSLDTISLGVWIREQLNNYLDWDAIEDELTKLEAKDPNFFGKDGEHTKSRTDLQKILSEFDDYLQRFYPL